jgi:DNA-binding response OmpR family regulator
MVRPAKVLIVDDEESIRSGLGFVLAREGFDVATAGDGDAALRAVRESPPDLIVLDVMLPRRSGWDVLRTLREEGRSTPVILLTARSGEADRVTGLDLGADDFVSKPFGLAELLARVRARLRRLPSPRESAPPSFELGGATIDLRALVVRRGARKKRLTSREADMLRLLYRERGNAVSRAAILDEVWSRDAFPTTRTIDQHIAKLRRKIEPDPRTPRHIITVFGVGYRLEL